MKSDRTKNNTREVMLKGYWPYKAPMGYENIKPKHRAIFHKYIITEEGRELKKGFQMILEERYNHQEIIDILRSRGVNLSAKNFRLVFSNPFYTGYVTGSLVDGKLIKGHHPALVDLKTFLKVQELLNKSPLLGLRRQAKREPLSLKGFAIDEKSGGKFTGFEKKGNWYYKTMVTGNSTNVNARILNGLFFELLKKYQYNPKNKETLTQLLKEEVKFQMGNKLTDEKVIRKNLTEKKSFLVKLEQKFINDEITKEIYQNHIEKTNEEIHSLEKQFDNTFGKSSTLEKAVEKCMKIAQNLSSAWLSGDYISKQKLQKLVFPEGIIYNKEKNEVLPFRINSLFSAIPLLERVSEENKNGDFSQNRQNSSKVPRTGIEPAHHC